MLLRLPLLPPLRRPHPLDPPKRLLLKSPFKIMSPSLRKWSPSFLHADCEKDRSKIYYYYEKKRSRNIIQDFHRAQWKIILRQNFEISPCFFVKPQHYYYSLVTATTFQLMYLFVIRFLRNWKQCLFLLIPRRRKNKRNELTPPRPSPSLSFSLITRPHYYYEFKHHNHFHNNTSHNFTKRKSIFSRLELISEFYVISSHKVQIPALPFPSFSIAPPTTHFNTIITTWLSITAKTLTITYISPPKKWEKPRPQFKRLLPPFLKKEKNVQVL